MMNLLVQMNMKVIQDWIILGSCCQVERSSSQEWLCKEMQSIDFHDGGTDCCCSKINAPDDYSITDGSESAFRQLAMCSCLRVRFHHWAALTPSKTPRSKYAWRRQQLQLSVICNFNFNFGVIYAYDDKMSIFTCASTDYTIIFCPTHAHTTDAAINPGNSGGPAIMGNKVDGRQIEVGVKKTAVVIGIMTGGGSSGRLPTWKKTEHK